MPIARKCLLWFIKICVGLVCAYLLLLAGLYWFLQDDPEDFANKYLSELAASTGLDFKFGHVSVRLLPIPALILGEVDVNGRKISFQSSQLSLRPDILSILKGNFQPGFISLSNPAFILRTDWNLANPEAIWEKFQPGSQNQELSHFLHRLDCRLEIINGQVTVTGQDNASIAASGIFCEGAIHKGLLSGDMQIASVRYAQAESAIASLENLKLTGNADLQDLLASSVLYFSGKARMVSVFDTADFYMDFTGKPDGFNGRLGLFAQLNLDNACIPLGLSGHVSSRNDKINFDNIEFHLDADSGSFNGDLVLKPDDFLLEGKLFMARLSLTQWLGFARNLTPGLQITLDNIFKATLKFALTSKGLQVPEIEAVCSGAKFSGEGSVQDFSRPVVYLNLAAEQVNLPLGIPESLGRVPAPVYFPHAPLTPLPSPSKAEDTGIDYDIRLGAQKVLYGPLTIQNGLVRIHQGQMDQNGFEDVLLDGSGKFYGGDVTGSCILGAPADFPINIVAAGNNINAAQLAKDLPKVPLRKGSFDFSANVDSHGKQLAVFLASLRGNVEVAGKNAVFHNLQDTFAAITGKAQLRGGKWLNERLSFSGKWRADIKDKKLTGSAQLDGAITFQENGGAVFNSLPGSLSMTSGTWLDVLPAKTGISAAGNWSLDKGIIRLDQGSLEIFGVKSALALKLDPDKISYSGTFKCPTLNLLQLCQKLGVPAQKLPEPWKQASFSAAYEGNGSSLSLTKIDASLGQSKITGDFSWAQKSGRPLYKFALAVNTLNIPKKSGQQQQKKDQPIDLSWLNGIDCSGSVWIKELDFWDFKLANLQTPLQLENGSLSVGPLTSRVYGARLNARGLADFKNGLNFNAVMAIHEFNLKDAAESRNLDGELKGTGKLDASIRAHVTNTSQLPQALHGDWEFDVVNGSWQSRDKAGKLSGSPTLFSKASASGQISGGILKSGNFALISSNLQVNGGGWLNLANDQLNCEFNINMKGLPNFPLRLYGTLKDTKTSIGAGEMVFNALGGIARGLLNIVGGIAGGIWSLFR